MKKLLRRPGFWLAIGLAIAIVVIVLLRMRGPVVTVVSPQVRDLEQHIIASGRVRVPSRVQIAAQNPGLVVAVGVAEGQRVKRGDLLVQLDDSGEQATVAQAEAAVKQASARVTQLRRVGAIVATEALRQAEVSLGKSTLDFERTSKLVASGAVPAIELENAQRALDIARAQKNAAQAQQVATAPMGADSRVALTILLQAEAQLAAAKVRLGQTRIATLHDGTVLERLVEPGDVVQPARTLLVVAADADVELEFTPDERNLAWIEIGQLAKAAADAFPQRPFDARVSYIAPAVDPQRGSVDVRLAVASPPAFLRANMTVSIDLMVAAKPAALVVPSSVVHGVATPTPWVMVARQGRATRQDVMLGIRGEGSIEIVSGLTETAAVIVPDGRHLAIGTRVRTERR